MKVLVLGGNGYLGNVLCPKLVNEGHEVTSVDLQWFGDNLPDTVNNINGDIRNGDLMEKEIAAADAVIHLAGVVGPGFCDQLPNLTHEINYEVMKNIIPLVKKKRYLYTSTCSIYGYDEDKFLDENSTGMFPVSHYGITKAKAENMIVNLLPNATVYRLGTLYGYSPRMRYDLVANIFIAQGLNGRTLTVFGGEQWRPMVCVEDVADGLVWALDKDLPGIHNMIYNNYTVKLLAELVSAKLGVDFSVDPDKSDVRSTIAKNYKIRSKGFTPKNSILDIIKPIKESNTWKDFDKKDIYNNMKMVNILKEKYEKGKVIVQ